MKFFIRLLSNDQTVAMEMFPHTTALEVKQAIFQQTGIAVTRLITSGIEWLDHQTSDEFVRHLNEDTHRHPVRDLFKVTTLYGIEERLVAVTEPTINQTTLDETISRLAKISFKNLKQTNADIACQISMDTRSERYALSQHPDTEMYWDNHLSICARQDALKKPSCHALVQAQCEYDQVETATSSLSR